MVDNTAERAKEEGVMAYLLSYGVGGLALLAAFFYGAWQRSRYETSERQLRAVVDEYAIKRIDWADEADRLEAVIAALKIRLKTAEEEAIANASPEHLRRRLDELLSSRP